MPRSGIIAVVIQTEQPEFDDEFSIQRLIGLIINARLFATGNPSMHTALICVLLAGFMPYLWTVVAKSAGTGYDNHDVRGWQARLSGLPQRAHAAHLNSFEAFPLFAVAVLVALANNTALERVNILAIAFIGLRLLYGALYLMDYAILRSLVWFTAMACTTMIFLTGL